MELIKFLKENDNWRELLSQSPYCLSIKEKDNYAIFKYNQLESDMSLKIVQESRGVIIDLNDYTVACRAFDKFFNVQEPHAAKLTKNIRALEKIDGSIIKVWSDRNGNVRVSTNGMIDAADADILLPVNKIKTYQDLFNEALNETDMKLEDFKKYRDYTLIFELVSPLNRIVVPYQNTELFFLGVRNNQSGQEWTPYDFNDENLNNNFSRPKLYDIQTVEQAIDVAKTLGADKEGFVLVDENFNRVKVKGSEYLAMHLLRNNTLSQRSFLEAILENKQDDLVAFFPEYEPFIHNIEGKIAEYINDAENALRMANYDLNKKDFALEVLSNECMKKFSSILFKVYRDRSYDWKSNIFNIANINKVMTILDL